MVPRDTVRKILEAGAQAPSGSNSQPWNFTVAKDVIAVHMHPEKDHPVLNFRSRGTIFAVGCLVENIAVAAAHYGIAASVAWFPKPADANMAALITLREDRAARKDAAGIFDAIYRRATNRKPYGTRPIATDVKERLLAAPAAADAPRVNLRIVEDRAAITAIAETESANEAVMFENRELHKLFFEELVWTDEEEERKGGGLYLPTMELTPPQRAALKLFRKWPFMRAMNRLVRAARGIARGNAKVYAACGAYGIVTIPDDDRMFAEAGRAVERAWLIATGAGLSFHLQTGVHFLRMRLDAEGIPGLSGAHALLIEKSYEAVDSVAQPAAGHIIPAVFRVGYDGEPSARSIKRPPEVSFV